MNYENPNVETNGGIFQSGHRASGQGGRSSGRPNFVLILTDDQGWGDLSVHGNANLETPNIDSLADDGALFDRFFVCPVCAPTRAELLTGRYHSRGGVHGVSTGAERLNLDEKTIGDTFRAGGYATAAFGKWHNGTQYPYHPNARGFDEYYGFCSGHWGQYFDPLLEHNGKIVRGEGFIIDDFTNHALDFIEENRDRPFFCYVPFNTPHAPFQVPDRFWDKFKNKPLEMRNRDPDREDIDKTRAALGLCENIDWNVGRILGKLNQLELTDNTVVIYLSDNGPNGVRWNGDMKGKKGSTDEGGVRVPCMIRWPGRIKPGTVITEIAGAIDFLPTLAEMAGIPVVCNKELDGRSLIPLLTGEDRDWPDRRIFSHWNGRVSVRDQQYRLDNDNQLFDLGKDPGQRRDISEELPEIASKLSNSVNQWKQTALSECGEDDRPFPVGHPDARAGTILPARDGVGHGNIERSARPPNCSFFTNWTDAGDSITWDVEVLTEGDYRISVYYTCPANDVGSVFELSFKNAKMQGTVAESHDPPLIGAEFDRVLRTESYVKNFRPMPLETVRLQKGRGVLTLRALQVANNQVMDVRALVVTLIG